VEEKHWREERVRDIKIEKTRLGKGVFKLRKKDYLNILKIKK